MTIDERIEVQDRPTVIPTKIVIGRTSSGVEYICYREPGESLTRLEARATRMAEALATGRWP